MSSPADNAGMTTLQVLCVEDDDLVWRVAKPRFEKAMPSRMELPVELVRAATIAEALARLTCLASPRFAGYIVDWRLSDVTCELILEVIRGLDPGGRIFIHTGFADDPDLCRTARMRFRCDVVEKSAGEQAWRDVFATFADRGRAQSEREARIALRAAPASITPREHLVLRAALEGATRGAIAAALDVEEAQILRTLHECAEKLLGTSSVDALLRHAW